MTVLRAGEKIRLGTVLRKRAAQSFCAGGDGSLAAPTRVALSQSHTGRPRIIGIRPIKKAARSVVASWGPAVLSRRLRSRRTVPRVWGGSPDPSTFSPGPRARGGLGGQMRFSVRRSAGTKPVPAVEVETARGTEIRGEHLLGVRNKRGQVEIKVRDEFLIVEDEVQKEADVA